MQIKRIIILAWLIFASSCTFAQNLIPVDTLMKKVRSAAEKYNEWVQTYDAEVYMRTYVETVKKTSCINSPVSSLVLFFTIPNPTKQSSKP